MKKYLNVLTTLTVMVCMAYSTTVHAQTQITAYVVAEEIIPEMPEYKRAQSGLDAYGKQLQKTLEIKQKEAEDYYSKIIQQVQAGSLSFEQQQQEETKVANMQADLQKEAAEAESKLAQKETELTKPLYEKFQAALEKVAKDNQYNYIIDKKFLLYHKDGIDATSKVKIALGIGG